MQTLKMCTTRKLRKVAKAAL